MRYEVNDRNWPFVSVKNLFNVAILNVPLAPQSGHLSRVDQFYSSGFLNRGSTSCPEAQLNRISLSPLPFLDLLPLCKLFEQSMAGLSFLGRSRSRSAFHGSSLRLRELYAYGQFVCLVRSNGTWESPPNQCKQSAPLGRWPR